MRAATTINSIRALEGSRLFVFVETMGAQTLGALISVINVAIATHALTRPEAGTFFIMMGVAIIAGTIGSLGFTTASAVILGRARASKEPDTVRGSTEVMLTIILLANILIGGLVLQASQSQVIERLTGVVLPLSLALPVAFQLAGVALGLACPAILLALGYIRQAAWLRYAAPNVVTLFFLGGSQWFIEPTLETTLWCYAAGFLVSGLASTIQAALAAIKIAPQSLRPKATHVLALSMPLMVTQLQVNLIDYGILWVAAFTVPISEIALLGMAQRVSSGCQIAFRSSVLLYMPAAAGMYSTGNFKDLHVLSKVTGLLTAAPALVLVALTMMAGQAILGSAFGVQYSDGWVPLTLLFAGYAARGLAGPGEYLLQVTGRHNVVVVCNAAYLLTLMIATYAFGQKGGATGVAAIIAGCTVIQQSVYLSLCKYWYGFSVGATFRCRDVRRALLENKV